MMEEILSKLNDSQKAAVLYNEGPSLVVAGAGSGKTRVLTYKIAGLLKQGYDASSILALTFTNKAANEMKKRIMDLVGDQARYLWMGTFHSIFVRILKRECHLLGFTKDFTIYDTDDSKAKVRDIIKEMGLNDKDYTPKKVLARISKLKNELIIPSAYMNRVELHQTDIAQKMPRFKEIYRNYMNQCHRANAMDFDDLLLWTNVLFRDFPDVLAHYQERFQFVLVDEYQDTNFSQHLIIRKLVDKHHRLCVVGDDAQSIYSFRGANIQNILKFQDNFKECKLFKLEQNYRSTPNIVEAANSLISKNKGQIKKVIFSENASGSKVKVISSYSDQDESNIVANLVKKMSSEYAYSDFAILYRTNAQSRSLEEAFRKRSIPYKIHGGHSFFQRRIVKDIFSYFRLVINQNDEEAFKRATQYPKKGIGNTTIDKIKSVANDRGISYWKVISDPLGNGLDLGAAAMKRLAEFREKIEEYSSVFMAENAYDLSDRILKECGIWQDLSQDKSDEAKDDKQLAEEVLNGIHEFCEERREETGENATIADYMEVVALMTDQDTDRPEDMDKVTLMTVHAAKGLEFKNVIIVGLEENLFPSDMSNDTQAGIEEERRLFYVALTRAEENCFVTFAKSRFLNGRTNYSSPSRFLSDIDAELLDLPTDFGKNTSSSSDYDDLYNTRRNTYGDWVRRASTLPTSFGSSNRPSFAKTETTETYERRNLRKISTTSTVVGSAETVSSQTTAGQSELVGKRVKHERFGLGVVKDVEIVGGESKLTILFDNAGEKKILTKYAKLEYLD